MIVGVRFVAALVVCLTILMVTLSSLPTHIISRLAAGEPALNDNNPLHNGEPSTTTKTISESSTTITSNQSQNDPLHNHDAVKPHVDLLIGITSSPDHGPQRQAVRETWLRYVTDRSNPHFITSARVAFFFFVGGRPENHDQPGHVHTGNDAVIAAEVAQHGDVLWVDHVEEYSALAGKTEALFRYAAREHNFTWFVKADDDTYIVVPRLLDALRKENKKTRLYMGQVRRGSKPAQSGKWEDKVFGQHTGQKLYPPFAAGWTYILSRDVVTFLSQTLVPWKHLPGEDVSTGMWLSAMDIHKVVARGFNSNAKCTDDYVVSHYVRPDAQRKRYESHISGGSPCVH